MVVTSKELLSGKTTIIKGKEYFSTEQYCNPFLERMSAVTNDFRIQVKLPDQMTKTDRLEDITYNRVLIQALLPKKYDVDGHTQVIGFLYGLDTKKPICKIYKGYENSACMNLTVFNPMWQRVQEILPGESLDYNIKPIMELSDNFAEKIHWLKNTEFEHSQENLELTLGKWVRHTLQESVNLGGGTTKLATSVVVNAHKNLFINPKSEIFIPQNVNPDMFTVYNALTQELTDDDKDLMNKFEKTLLISKLLEVK